MRENETKNLTTALLIEENQPKPPYNGLNPLISKHYYKQRFLKVTEKPFVEADTYPNSLYLASIGGCSTIFRNLFLKVVGIILFG
jgi:hypothetical protein